MESLCISHGCKELKSLHEVFSPGGCFFISRVRGPGIIESSDLLQYKKF